MNKKFLTILFIAFGIFLNTATDVKATCDVAGIKSQLESLQVFVSGQGTPGESIFVDFGDCSGTLSLFMESKTRPYWNAFGDTCGCGYSWASLSTTQFPYMMSNYAGGNCHITGCDSFLEITGPLYIPIYPGDGMFFDLSLYSYTTLTGLSEYAKIIDVTFTPTTPTCTPECSENQICSAAGQCTCDIEKNVEIEEEGINMVSNPECGTATREQLPNLDWQVTNHYCDINPETSLNDCFTDITIVPNVGGACNPAKPEVNGSNPDCNQSTYWCNTDEPLNSKYIKRTFKCPAGTCIIQDGTLKECGARGYACIGNKVRQFVYNCTGGAGFGCSETGTWNRGSN